MSHPVPSGPELESADIHRTLVQAIRNSSACTTRTESSSASIIHGSLAMSVEDLPGGSPDPVSLTDSMTTSIRTADRDTEVTRRLLMFVGELRGRVITVNPSEILASIEVELRQERPDMDGVEFRLKRGTGPIACVPDQLRTAVNSLIRNATEATTGHGGIIRVEVSRRGCAVEELRTTRIPPAPAAGQFVSIRVQDTGPGITLDIQ